MRRRHLDSSAIASAGYDPDTALLELEFASGEVYQYFAVPRAVYEGLVEADSAGRFFRDRIRDVYPSRHLH